jgi:hypothetical protein
MRISGRAGCLFIVTVLVAALVIPRLLLYRTLMREIFLWARYGYHSDSMKPVEVVLGKENPLQLYIPAAYISVFPQKPGKPNYYIELQVYLPDMLPSTLSYSRHPEVALGDQTAITELRQSWLYISLTSIDSASLNGFFQLMEFFKHSFIHRPEDDQSPFEIYDSLPPFDGRGSSYSYNMSRRTVYFPKNSNEYYLLCYGEHMSAYVCSINFIYRQIIQANVNMQPSNISRPEYVRRSISDFFDRITATPQRGSGE